MLKRPSFLLMVYRPVASSPSMAQRTRIPTRLVATASATASPDMSSLNAAKDFIRFVNDSPTPYHAVASAVSRLQKAGFVHIKEKDPWVSEIQPGGKYFITRNASSIIAFAVGRKWRPGSPIAMVGAHTDSPCLRFKPVSKKTNAGFMQVGVETYGGGIWHSWFDRDLGVAGRVLVKTSDGAIVPRLVKIDKPVLRIPTLAIHLDRSANFEPNKETELFPIAGLVEAELNKADEKDVAAEAENKPFQPLAAMGERHHPHIVDLIAETAGVSPSDIVDFEMLLFDTQPPCLGGLNDEFIFSARLDNLNMAYCTIVGLLESSTDASLENDSTIRLAACFDHEEIGSLSAQGANSSFLPSILRRLAAVKATNDDDASWDVEPDSSAAFEQTLARSFLISADMAHSVHPNYAGKYESDHRPVMNKGTVIKVNANQRYATNSPGVVLVQECARRAEVPLQLFVVRNDSPCGSTIGPMLSAKMGVRTLDLGNPQLSMHSIRETGGTHDVKVAVELFRSFYESYGELEEKIIVD
ncbi:Aspartyl aminopeptidase [Scedosporium apiospermum]|uniref:aspartyl aminopeptidase n=1 Tax=Pseudallescheria apiosperma TaxID=563466 RepID=A0A084G5E4_PSEDA|nr:Aspartyl aminopeptidase [Scedosporium apiospermum]KEZ42556.1 Aspartyl aminopeptidase [Scedosporium apiospermum]